MIVLRIISIIVILILHPAPVFSGNFSFSRLKTPFGNTIEYSNSYSIFCSNRLFDNWNKTEVRNIKKWYFYKKHIIGEYENGNRTSYFIFNDANGDVNTYEEKTKFDDTLKEQGLVPIIWNRQFDSFNGVIYNRDDGFFRHFNETNCLIIGIFLFYVFNCLLITKFNLKKKINKVNTFILILIVIRVILDLVPYSI